MPALSYCKFYITAYNKSMLIITKNMLQQFLGRKGYITYWVVESLFPKPPIFVSNIVIDVSRYSKNTQKRIKNVISGFISFTTKQFFVNDIIKRIDYNEKVLKNDIRISLMLSLYINDKILPPYDIHFSDIQKEKAQDKVVTFARRFKYLLKGKELSPQTIILITTLLSFKHNEHDKILKRKRISFGSKEKEKIDIFRNELEKNIQIVYTK